MTVVLICNVGNNDVQLTDRALLPDELRDRQWIEPRILGETILKDYARYAPALVFPLIEPALRWLLENRVSEGDLRVHLFASDQEPPPVTLESEWRKDSLPFAQVIERWLKEGGPEWQAEIEKDGRKQAERRRLRLSGKQIRIHRIAGNPADYQNMLATFDRELPKIAEQTDDLQAVYLEVTGGTPAMTSMLIVAGVQVFGKNVHTLYVERGASLPYEVGIGRRLFAQRAKETLRTQLKLCAYASALETVKSEGDLLAPDVERRTLLAALLEYADRRLAFDFEAARACLRRAQQHAVGTDQARIQGWQRELNSQDAALQLAELIHSAAIRYRLGDYADFLGRLFRFQEAAFRYMAEQMGMRYSQPNSDMFVDKEWVAQTPGLQDYLQEYATPVGKGIKLDTALNRISLGAIVDFFTERVEAWKHQRSAFEQLSRLSRLAELRNKGLAGHGFRGISRADLAEAFGAEADSIVPTLQQIYHLIFGQSVGADPYEAVNEMCRALVG